MTLYGPNGEELTAPAEEPKLEKPSEPPAWWWDLLDGETVQLNGHWWKVHGKFNDAVVLAYDKPTGKHKKRGKGRTSVGAPE